MTKKNKLNDTNKGKYENPKKSTDTQLNNMVSNNASQKSNNVIINANLLKNDTYESVCSPEDTAERTKTAQRHSIAVNNTISPTNAHNSNSSMPSNANCSGNSSNSNRILKRVISAPVATNDTKGNYFPLCSSVQTSLLSERQKKKKHCNRKSSRVEPVWQFITHHIQFCT